MIVKGSKVISQFPDGSTLSEGFEFEIDDDSIKQLVHATAREFMMTNTGVGELLDAAQIVLAFKGKRLTDQSLPIFTMALNDLEQAVKKIRQGSASKPSDVGN
jgi:hypothetical protein